MMTKVLRKNGTLQDLEFVVFEDLSTLPNHLTGDYGIAKVDTHGLGVYDTLYIPISRNNADFTWRELARNVNQRGVFYTGMVKGKSTTLTMSQEEMRSRFASLAGSTVVKIREPIATPVDVVKYDGLVFDSTTQTSFFVLKGTSAQAVGDEIALRKMNQETTKILNTANNTTRPLYKTTVVTTLDL